MPAPAAALRTPCSPAHHVISAPIPQATSGTSRQECSRGERLGVAGGHSHSRGHHQRRLVPSLPLAGACSGVHCFRGPCAGRRCGKAGEGPPWAAGLRQSDQGGQLVDASVERCQDASDARGGRPAASMETACAATLGLGAGWPSRPRQRRHSHSQRKGLQHRLDRVPAQYSRPMEPKVPASGYGRHLPPPHCHVRWMEDAHACQAQGKGPSPICG
mmetsp:Transcript_8511/g.20998  ORF Transcript_8511/g.20998 Transcript_8511/m.20998 type:complete len:216 (-) Transcript_8511:364-1011(-)